MSEFYQRLFHLITGGLFLLGAFANYVAVRDYFKKLRAFKMNKHSEHPYKKLMVSTGLFAIVMLTLFFLLGGFNFVSDYLYPEVKKTSTKNQGNSLKTSMAAKPILDTIHNKSIPTKHKNKRAIKQNYTSNTTITQTNKNGDNVAGNKSAGKNNFDAGKGNTFNAPVHNGDNIYINADRTLTTPFLERIFAQVDNVQKTNNRPKILRVNSYTYSNVPLVPNQIATYFKERGYEIKAVGGLAFADPNVPQVRGISIDTADHYAINISVGYFPYE